uniref:homeodomain-interacting protein kinase 2-like n=1 Tax=Monopterus albus TaxID=43700 RepID=UPI0009B493A4|nr:homeodomain-interacting protein kinase 2-like [Monopterus albus]
MSSTGHAVQDHQIIKGEKLTSSSSTYRVRSFLGQGTFGTVVTCTRMVDMKTVAIKMIKNQGFYAEDAKNEVATLLKLKSLDSDKCNLVRWYQVFSDKNHICLEFEHLDKSLYDFMKERYFRPFLLKEIRPIVQQIASALGHLKAVEIIHADLKMKNVMLVNHQQEPYKIKVIDFGLAHHVSAANIGSYIQTLPYRSPEVILGLPLTEALDMWSLGCIAAFMYLGTLLYPGRHEYDMMRYIVDIQGQPPDHLLNLGHKTHIFFERDCTTSSWKLKTPARVHRETGIQPMETRRLRLSSLDAILRHKRIIHEDYADSAAEMNDVLLFVDMLKAMLELDAAKRITPCQVTQHPFISMRHLKSLYPLSNHVRSCFEMMVVCWNKAPTPDKGKAACGLLQEGSRFKPQNLPSHPPAEVQPHCSNPHPCTSSQTTFSNESGMKRKVDHEDLTENDHPSKRVKHSQDPTNLSHPVPINAHPSKDSQTQKWIRSEVKMASAEGVRSRCVTFDHYRRLYYERMRVGNSSAGPSTSGSSTQTQTCTSPQTSQSGLKRKAADVEDVQPRKKPSVQQAASLAQSLSP